MTLSARLGEFIDLGVSHLYSRDMFEFEDKSTIWGYDDVPAECKLHDDVYLSGKLYKKKGIRPFVGSVDVVLRHHEWKSNSVTRSWVIYY